MPPALFLFKIALVILDLFKIIIYLCTGIQANRELIYFSFYQSKLTNIKHANTHTHTHTLLITFVFM